MDGLDDPKAAKAEAKAVKARAKAMRPWYKKKRYYLSGILLLLIVASIAGSQDDTKTTDTSAKENDAPSKQAARIGERVRDGKFEFTVTKIECGKRRVGSTDFGKAAQGQYCFVSLTVENIGDEPQSLFGDNQYLFDAQGRKFSADTEAAIYVEDSKAIFEEINPGNSLDGIVIYDIPKGATPSKIELHDSAFSGGVVVNLA